MSIALAVIRYKPDRAITRAMNFLYTEGSPLKG